MKQEQSSPCPWSLALPPAIIVSGAATLLVALVYRDLAFEGLTRFFLFLFTTLAAVWSLTLGILANMATLFYRRSHWSRAITRGIGFSTFLLLSFWGYLTLETGRLSIKSSFGLAALAGAVVTSIFVALCAALAARFGFRRVPRAGLFGPVCLALSLALFFTRPDSLPAPAPIRPTSQPAADSPINADDTNLLLITIDTLRADHLPFYGYSRQTTRRLTNLAARSVVFDRCITARTSTGPSLASIMTGCYPPTHRVFNNGDSLQDFNITLAELLSNKGYHNRAVISTPILTAEYHFDQGFEEFEHNLELNDILKDEINESRNLNTLILPVLDDLAKRKFFLWIHYRDPHSPYLVPEDYRDLFTGDQLAKQHNRFIVPIKGRGGFGGMAANEAVYGSQDLDFLIAQYDSEIRFNDDSLGAVFDKMDALKMWDNTLVVFSADHGEDLSEHNSFFDHGDNTYEPCAHVPLFIYHPKLPHGRRIPTPVGLVDLASTILDLLNLPPNPEAQGQSFAPLVLGQPLDSYRTTHYILGESRYGYQTHAVTTATHKLVFDVDERWLMLDALIDPLISLWLPDHADNIYRHRNVQRELYDIQHDPGELLNLAGKLPNVEAPLAEALWSWIESTYHQGSGRETITPEASANMDKALKALGY